MPLYLDAVNTTPSKVIRNLSRCEGTDHAKEDEECYSD